MSLKREKVKIIWKRKPDSHSFAGCVRGAKYKIWTLTAQWNDSINKKLINSSNDLIKGRLYCELKIPNEEVHIFYENLIKKWFQETITNQKYELMINMLITGEIEIFAGLFEEFVRRDILNTIFMLMFQVLQWLKIKALFL